MTDMRRLGLMIKRYAELADFDTSAIAEALGCTEEQVIDLYSGRLLLSYKNFETLSKKLGVELESFLQTDEKYYEENVVCCKQGFTSGDNRERILDIIDVYLFLCDAVDIGRQ